jgi:GNAT superfamily N-acetyltransferase
MSDQPVYEFQYQAALPASESSDLVKAVSIIFNNSFGINPKNGRPYTLGPRITRKRLAETDHLFLATHSEAGAIAYLYARVMTYSGSAVGWIDSLAVLPSHRRKGIATRLVKEFTSKIPACRWVGCATPNPIAALVISREVHGTFYIGNCNPPQEVIDMINGVRHQCPDLTGVEFNPTQLLVRTSFSPISSEDTKEWSPPSPSEPPPWWSSLSNLEDCEALLIIDRIAQVTRQQF